MATNSHNIHSVRLSIDRTIKTLINNDLKEICRHENIQVSGVKATLQKRILDHLDSFVSRGDVQSVERLRFRVHNGGRSPPPERLPSSLGRDTITPISPAPTNTMSTSTYTRPAASLSHFHQQSRVSVPNRHSIKFRESPFYQIREALSPMRELIEMPHNRHSVHEPLVLSDAVCNALKADKSLAIMIYCAPGSSLGPYAFNIDIAFPSQIEVKVNSDEVRKSFKGLKNKPGTTKPVDITDMIRKAPGYQNDIHVTYALTKERFSLMINLVKKTTTDELSLGIKHTISKESVLREMVQKAQDPDIQATRFIMSLKCPLSTMRMTLPCRSNVCTHNQCFDVSSFLQLQEQAPTWTCPVCMKTISYQGLCIDNYVKDILQNTSKSTESVDVAPDGKWTVIDQGEDDNRSAEPQKRAAYDNDSDDDVIEIEDTPKKKSDTTGHVKMERNLTPVLAQQTPPISRETSMVAPRSNGTGNKRPSAVIDLTGSDDEEDEPPRPAKRANTSQNTSYNTPASLQDGRFADLANRPQSVVGRAQNPIDTLALPPIKAPQPNGGLPQGQRLPWPHGAPIWTNAHRESNSYSPG